ncbi:MAG: hypothetical protein SD837_11845 [Candidatus Electrothrix scaldis]|nr:MAG: hypothetical protein SD837_11845 [Candidatus Electrothrix sp. GW3-3]
MMKCIQCGSPDIVRDVKVVDHGHYNTPMDLGFEVHEAPEAWVFKGTHRAVLKGNVCVDCGYVMFSVSVSDAQKLKKYKK